MRAEGLWRTASLLVRRLREQVAPLSCQPQNARGLRAPGTRGGRHCRLLREEWKQGCRSLRRYVVCEGFEPEYPANVRQARLVRLCGRLTPDDRRRKPKERIAVVRPSLCCPLSSDTVTSGCGSLGGRKLTILTADEWQERANSAARAANRQPGHCGIGLKEPP